MRTNTADSWAGRVAEYTNDHAREVIDDLGRAIRTPSVGGTPEENSLLAELAERSAASGLDVDHWQIPLDQTMAAAGFPGVEVDRTEAWGLVSRLPGAEPADAPSLMLNAHIDVVPPGDRTAWSGDPFTGAVSATEVFGRGACDMKGGLIAARWAVQALSDLRVPLRGDVLLACVQGEEDGGLGTFAMLERGWRADACVIPEPTSLDIVPANGGALTFRLRVRGLATHASRRSGGVSAVEKFTPVFAALRELEARRNADVDPLMDRWDIAYPIEIGTVRAGDWSSSVPDLLIAEGRYGVALGESPELAKADFEAALAATCAADAWLRDHPVEITWWGGQFASGQTPGDAPVLAAVRSAHARVSDHPQGTWGAPYGSDLRLMTAIGGVPTVHYGPGDAGLAHGPDERVPIAEVLTAARALAVLAIDLCGLR